MPREVGVLAVIAFVVALGFGVVAPAIPLFARSFGVGTTAVGLAVSAFAFFRFVSAFSGGSLVERYGERTRSEEHTSELQSRQYLVCRLLLEKKMYYPIRRTHLLH